MAPQTKFRCTEIIPPSFLPEEFDRIASNA